MEGRKPFGLGPFEMVCVAGGLAAAVAYTLSDVHFTLTILSVAVLAVLALLFEGFRG